MDLIDAYDHEAAKSLRADLDLVHDCIAELHEHDLSRARPLRGGAGVRGTAMDIRASPKGER